MANNQQTQKKKGRGHPADCLCSDCADLMSEWNIMDDKGKEETVLDDSEPPASSGLRNFTSRFRRSTNPDDPDAPGSVHLRNFTHRIQNKVRDNTDLRRVSEGMSELLGRRRGEASEPSSSSSSSSNNGQIQGEQGVHLKDLNFEFWLNDRAEEEQKRSERARTGMYSDIVLVEEEYGFMDMDFSMSSIPEFEQDETKGVELFLGHVKANGLAAAVIGQPIPASLRGEYWAKIAGVEMSPEEICEEYEHKKEFAMSKIGVSPDLSQVPSLGCDLVEVLRDHFPLPEEGDRDTAIESLRVQFKRVMCVLARFNVDTLQAIGIADTVGLLLSFVDEEEAFWIAHQMMKRSKVDRWYFQLNASQYESILRTFILLLRQRHRKLYEGLGYMSKNQDKGWKDLASLWFSRLFVNCFSPLCRARMIDLFLLDGIEACYRVGLALVGQLQDVLQYSTNVAQALESVQKEVNTADFSHILDSKKSKIRFITKSKINKLHELTSNQVGVLSQSLEVFYNPTPSENSLIMVRPTHWLVVYSGLPLNLRTYDPTLLFRGSTHGFLLSNLLRRVKGLMYTIILIRSQNGEVFGGFGAEEWKLSPKYSGKRSSFVFSLVSLSVPSTTDTATAATLSSTASTASSCSPSTSTPKATSPKPKLVASGDLYRWKLGNPEFFQLADVDALCFGQSIRLDDELGKGWSRCCPTFKSPGFCVNTSFEISDVEVWGLKHPAQAKCK